MVWSKQPVGVFLCVRSKPPKPGRASSELLRVVEDGETVAITRHGRRVAHLVPAPEQDRAARKAAVERFRQRRAGWESVAFSHGGDTRRASRRSPPVSGLVVDASVVLAWLFDDDEEPRSDRALERLVEDGVLVPHLWHLETRNALLVAGRKGRLSDLGVKERLDAMKGLPVRTDETPDLQSAFDLARGHDLSFYDAVYLELAKRERAEFATLDRALRQAAAVEGVALTVAGPTMLDHPCDGLGLHGHALGSSTLTTR